MKIKILTSSVLLALGTQVYAETAADEMAVLKQQVKVLAKRIEQLQAQTNKQEHEKAAKVAEQSTADTQKASWASRMAFSGDLRDRFEYIDEKGKSARTRNRVRLRVGANAKVNDKLNVGLQLASGADDPVSTNQTMGDAFSTKDVRLNLAYFDWRLNDVLTLTGGKMKNPFYQPQKNPVLWDGDLNPEGFALKFNRNGFSADLVGFSVEERKAADDILLYGGQIRQSFAINNGAAFIAGVGYYDYSGLKGSAPLFDGKARGNSLDQAGNIANDFNIIEGLLEYQTELAGRPLSVFGSYHQNTEADDLDSAIAFGIDYGKVKAAGSWRVGYAYMDIEADAVYALFNDSDFAGGNTDATGHVFKFGYGLGKNMSFAMTYIDSEKNQSANHQTAYDRLQADISFKFK